VCAEVLVALVALDAFLHESAMNCLNPNRPQDFYILLMPMSDMSLPLGESRKVKDTSNAIP
jgi:hypothetical protein